MIQSHAVTSPVAWGRNVYEEASLTMTIIIPPDQLQPQTLCSLIEEFVTCDGTRYGHREATLGEMVAAV